MYDKQYLRYVLNKNNISIEDIAKRRGQSVQNINKKIFNGRLYFEDIEVIIELCKLKFEDIFLKEG